MKQVKFILLLLGGLFLSTGLSAELLVEKQRFEMDSYTTFAGKTIRKLAVGWESYGQLNATKDNVILITHYFSGNSHAAGKYAKSDPTPGYWDSIIGPGKAIDTNRFFVISVDTLANLAVHDPNVITTGPATINPGTGKPYGLDFPVVTIRDFVNVQKALLESLGIKSLHAVVGPSMGSMQAIEWAVAYPDWVPRMISVIGSAQTDPWTTTLLEKWALPIRLDKHWNDGNYYSTQPPIEGLIASLMLITQDALHPQFFNQTGGSEAVNFKALETGPLNDIRQTHSIVSWLKNRAASRATYMDANHLLYLVRACQLFIAGHNGDLSVSLKKIKAKTLFLPAHTDLLLMPYLAEDAYEIIKEHGKSTAIEHLDGSLGHLEGVAGITQKADTIAAFLNN